MTTVIEALEAQDNSPTTKVEKLLQYITTLSEWFYPVDREVCSARSTHFVESPQFNNYPPEQFVVEIKTTKSAISDKRFEVLLDNPPEGYVVMGKHKSRKDGTVKYQFVRMDDPSLTMGECVNIARKEELKDLTRQVDSEVECLQENFQNMLTGQVTAHTADKIHSNRCVAEYYNTLKATLEDFMGKMDILQENNPNVGMALASTMVYNLSFEERHPVSQVRYNLKAKRLVSNILHEEMWGWREGDSFPRNTLYRLRQMV